MTNEITTTDLSTAVTSFYDDVVVPLDKQQVPFIKLLQSQSDEVLQDGEDVGTFKNPLTLENYGKEVHVIPIRPQFGAVLIDPEDNRTIKCKSNDGVTSINGDRCTACPHGCYYRTWTKDAKTGKNTPPACKETVNVVILLADTLMPAILSFKSNAYPTGIKLVNAAKARAKQGVFVFTVTSQFEKFDKGSAFIPKLSSDVLPVTAAQLEAAINLKQAVSTNNVEVVE